MKKRLILKKWVQVVLYFIFILSLFIFVSDSDDIKTFVIWHIIALGAMVSSFYLLYKYTYISNEGE